MCFRIPECKELLLTGNLTARERCDALKSITAGEYQLIVGTQAVIQDDVRFHRLGLVVIDEQHKFGVMQRSHVSRKGIFVPDVESPSSSSQHSTLSDKSNPAQNEGPDHSEEDLIQTGSLIKPHNTSSPNPENKVQPVRTSSLFPVATSQTPAFQSPHVLVMTGNTYSSKSVSYPVWRS